MPAQLSDIVELPDDSTPLARVHEFTRAVITGTAAPEELVQRALATAAQSCQGDSSVLYVRNERDAVLQTAAVHGVDPATTGDALLTGQGLSGHVWERREPLIINDYVNWPGATAHGRLLHVLAAIAVPVFVQHACAGVLLVRRTTPGAPFTSDHARLLDLYAAQVGS